MGLCKLHSIRPTKNGGQSRDTIKNLRLLGPDDKYTTIIRNVGNGLTGDAAYFPKTLFWDFTYLIGLNVQVLRT
jgi:hypothetical protein